MKQNRWKSKVVWLTIIALVLILGDNYNLWAVIGMTNEVFQKVADLILAVLVGVGILNNPTDKENW